MNEMVKAEVERMLPYLPTEPPEDTLEIVTSRGYLQEHRLLYGCEWRDDENAGKKVRKVKVICTSCGGVDYLEYVQDGCGRYGATNGFIDPYDNSVVSAGMNCICPCCGRGTAAMRRPSARCTSEIDEHVFMSAHNILGHLTLLSWLIKKFVRNDGTVFYKVDLYEGIAVIGKTLVRLKGYYKYMNSYTFLDHWEYTLRYDSQFGAFGRDEVIAADYCATDLTECEKSGLVPYLKATHYGKLYPAEYLRVWLKYPNVENLVTAGYDELLGDVLSKAVGYYRGYTRTNFEFDVVMQCFNLKMVRPVDILGIDREDIPIAKSGDYRRLDFYRTVKREFGVKLNEDQLDSCRKQIYDDFLELVACGLDNGHDVKIVHLINYLTRQSKACTNFADASLISARYMRDYWRMIYKVYREMPEELIYPRDLRAAHDEIQERIRDEENAKVNEQIVARVDELSRFNYYDEETMLFIRPAASYREFINEGKKLSHCVANYAKTHASGGTNIFFIRNVDEPDVPYFTLEVRFSGANVNVLQNRGRGNCARTEEVQRFEDKWVEFVKNIIMKENKKNGRRNRKRDDERIGA